MNSDIRSRLLTSFLGNFFRSGLTFITGVLLARWLGPIDYGRMVFLLSSFLAFRQLIDMAASSAFFTFISQKPRSNKFLYYYFCWIAFQFLLLTLILGIIFPLNWIMIIWNGESRGLVMLALMAVFMQNIIWPMTSQMSESIRLSVELQRVGLVLGFCHLGVVILLWLVGKLVVPILLGILALEYFLGSIFLVKIYFNQRKLTSLNISSKSEDTLKSILKEFVKYCFPLIPYAWLGFACNFADIWMLQHWGGSSQQAFYAIATQFSAISLLMTTSVLNILWKEVAEAHHESNLLKANLLFSNATHSLYFLSAFIAGGLMPWSKEIIDIFLGPAYLSGATTLAVMFLYPLHQTLGQICITIFYATNRTHLQAIIGAIFMIFGLIGAYFVLAPVGDVLAGFDLSSIGLASKMVVIQILAINVMLWYVARIFNSKFTWAYQIAGLLVCVAGGYLIKNYIISYFDISTFLRAPIFFAIYLLWIGAFIHLGPSIFGLKKTEINYLLFGIKKL